MSNRVKTVSYGIGVLGIRIAKAALKEGWDVKKSEVHGMAQRGGSVISEVRSGKKVYSPLYNVFCNRRLPLTL